MPKFKSNISRPTDTQVFAAMKGHPFKQCASCGNSVISSVRYCNECKRLLELDMAPAQRQFVQANPGADTQESQSFSNDNCTGYSDRISSSKFPANKERV